MRRGWRGVNNGKKFDLSKIAGTKQLAGEHEYVSTMALAVHPHQVDEANRKAVERGINVRFDKAGHAHCGKSAFAYDAVARGFGLTNVSGCFRNSDDGA